MIIEGINSLSGRDVYTGRVLWTRKFEDLGTFVDPSLEFRRYLCRDTMCNTCFAKVNGRSRLTCLEKVPEDAEELVIEPIDNFELIRDLMVNYSVHKSKGA